MSSIIRSLMVKVGADLSDFKSNMATAAKAMEKGFGELNLTDTTSAIAGLNDSIKLTQSEFKAATAGMSDWKDNTDGLNARIKYLNDTMDDQLTKLEGMRRQYELVSAESGENSNKAVKLKIAINNQTAEFKKNEAELKDVTERLDKFGKETDDAAEKTSLFGDVFTGSFWAGVAKDALSAIISKIKELGQAAFDTADELMQLSAKTGLTTERLQELQYIGDDLGVSLDEIANAQVKLTKAMYGAYTGTAEYTEAFRKLGVTIIDPTTGALKSASDVMWEAFEALNNVGNETERDALAMKIFGKSATELNPIIKAGTETLTDLATQAKESGAIMTEEAVAGLDALGDAWTHFIQTAEAEIGEFIYSQTIAGDKEQQIIFMMKSGYYTLESAAAFMGMTIEEVTAIMNNYNNELAQTTQAEADAAAKSAELEAATSKLGESQTAIEEDLASLQKAYEDAYNAAYNSMSQQVGLFEDLDETGRESTESLIQSLQSQIDYIAEYNKNLKAAMKKGVDDGLIEQLSDGSEESAQILATLAGASDTQITKINENFAKVEEGKATFGTAIATMETDFTASMDAIDQRMIESVEEFNQSEAAREAGQETVEGYILGLRSKAAAVRAAISVLTGITTDTMDEDLGINSPSTVMRDKGQNVGEGYTLGIEDQEPALQELIKRFSKDTADLTLPNISAYSAPDFSELSGLNESFKTPAAETGAATGVASGVQTVTHTGTIRVEGVSSKGELVGVVDLIAEDMAKQSRRYPSAISFNSNY